MKEPQVKGQFQQAVEKLRENEDSKKLLAHLGAIREAVTELQAEGVALSLEVRPGAYKCPIEFDSRVRHVVNGTIHMGSVDIDFAIVNGAGSSRFIAYLGATQLGQNYLSSGNDSLKEKVTEIILSAGAQTALLDEFNIDEGGRPGIATGKALSVLPPIRLKSNPKT